MIASAPATQAGFTTATYTIMIGGKPCTYDHQQLRSLAASRAGMAFDAERAMLAYYVKLGVLLLEVRRVIGGPKSYTAFLRGAEINLKKAGRAVRFAAEFGTEHGEINRVRLFELLHAFDARRWPTIDALEHAMPGIRATEAAMRSPAAELSTEARTHVSTESDDATGSGDEWDGAGDEWDAGADDDEIGEASAGVITMEEALAKAPVIDFDDDDNDTMRSRAVVARQAHNLEDAGSSPASAIEPRGVEGHAQATRNAAWNDRTCSDRSLESSDNARTGKASEADFKLGSGSSSLTSRGVGGESSPPSVQMTLASLYEETARKVSRVADMIRTRALTESQCRRLMDLIDELDQD